MTLRLGWSLRFRTFRGQTQPWQQALLATELHSVHAGCATVFAVADTATVPPSIYSFCAYLEYLAIRAYRGRYCSSIPRASLGDQTSGQTSEVCSTILTFGLLELEPSNTMPSKAEENLPPTNEGYGTKEYW